MMMLAEGVLFSFFMLTSLCVSGTLVHHEVVRYVERTGDTDGRQLVFEPLIKKGG